MKDPTSNLVSLALPPLTSAASWAVLLLSATLILAPQARAEALLWLHGCLYGMLGVLVLLGDWRAGNLSKNFSQLFRDRIKASVETWALIAGGLALIVT